ncbi:hypothetical protein BCR33DRAFT_356071 [Rhizoclosmatium globosum]|uniref:Uncharacterized protein n=1 Tax=Rhizoclosmatium globosum TaxID=329046 RepID=A0A1Y2C0V5_9FUNG|nr:hypothetical protein BCR33DRAFT_356071 [Rhizoclosmatium globosum]|eukprot:ORY40662.1 hypothetical protein BCR33DRAFT_356071 [Rhizoclosmatium globosum]
MLILLNDKVGSVKVMSEEYHKAKEEVVKLKTEVEMEKAARAAAEQARITAEQDNAKLLERIRLLEKGISLATPTKPVFKPIVPKTAQPVPVPPTVPATSVPIPSLPNTPTRSTTDLPSSSLQSTPQQSSALSQLPSSVPVSTTSSNKYTDWRRFSSTGLEDSLGLFIAYDDGPFDKVNQTLVESLESVSKHLVNINSATLYHFGMVVSRCWNRRMEQSGERSQTLQPTRLVKSGDQISKRLWPT